MSLTELIAYLKASKVHIAILVIGVLSGVGLYSKFKSGELSLDVATLETEVASKKSKIKGLEKQLRKATAELEELTEREAMAVQYADLMSQLKDLREASSVEMNKLESVIAGRIQAADMFATYKTRYRNFIRAKASGTKMDELTTLDGKTYKQVTIKSVGAVGMSITHSGGSRRIPYKELPGKLQRQYQFDEEEAEAQQKKEAERLRQQQLAREAAERAAEQAAHETHPDLIRKEIAKMEQAIKKVEQANETIEVRIDHTNKRIQIERSKTISRAPEFRAELEKLKKAKSDNKDKIRDLNEKIRDLKRELR